MVRSRQPPILLSMSPAPRPGRKASFDRPAGPPQNAQERGATLKALIVEAGITQGEFAERTGISRTMLTRYLSGASDLADMTTEIASGLIHALRLSDEAAWATLNIPEARQGVWRSITGSRPQEGETVRLHFPLCGVATAPAGSRLHLSDEPTGLTVFLLPDGRYYATETDVLAEVPQPLGGVRLGFLAGVSFPRKQP